MGRLLVVLVFLLAFGLTGFAGNVSPSSVSNLPSNKPLVSSAAEIGSILLGVLATNPAPAAIDLEGSRARLVEVESLIKSNELEQTKSGPAIRGMKQAALKDNPAADRLLQEIDAKKKEQVALIDATPEIVDRASNLKGVETEEQATRIRFKETFAKLQKARNDREGAASDPALAEAIAVLEKEVRAQEARIKELTAEHSELVGTLRGIRTKAARANPECMRIEEAIQAKIAELQGLVNGSSPELKALSRGFEERQRVLRSLYAERRELQKTLRRAEAGAGNTSAGPNS